MTLMSGSENLVEVHRASKRPCVCHRDLAGDVGSLFVGKPSWMSGRRNEGYSSGLSTLAVRLDGNFHILLERGQQPHQLFDRMAAELSAQQVGQVWLLDTKDLGGSGLRQLPLGNQPFELHGQR